MVVEYNEGDTIPNMTFGDGDTLPAWRDSAGDIVDFSSGYTFALTCYKNGVSQFTKSTGITGAATNPNLTVNWASTGEVGDLDPGTYVVHVVATSSGETRSATVTLVVKDATR